MQSKNEFRNLAKIIERTSDTFDYAYSKGIMTLYARSAEGRRVVDAEGTNLVDFARGSYLGLDNHPSLIAAAVDAMSTYQTLQWSGARTRLNFSLTRNLEESLSDLLTARALVFSLVLTANMGILPLIACGALTNGQKPVVVFDRFAHATLSYHKAVMADDTEVITIGHNDMEELENICKRHPVVAYVADGVYSMGGSAPLAELQRLQSKYGMFLYIDDAHGISIVGKNGEGYARSAFSSLGERTVIAASLSKGFGATGGVLMLGTEQQEKLLRRYAVPHTFSMGPDLAGIAAALASAELHRTEELPLRQARLRNVLKLFDEHIESAEVDSLVPIRMVVVGNERAAIDAAAELRKMGFYVAAAFFPTVAQGKAALRVCLTADHEPSDVIGLCAAIRRCLDRIVA
ncbi:aminotransferase class I/II-fold pyridoxal phosphate-dependent enzyme [Gluconacetobacter azotocaptans]|uniref:aminotransferase class I/II-fold pyridoxal phosphate-dependent enzyme n=1 Tax=Gluconacetobacter azotocaptans TaxID=142834 RepID=UPI00195AE80A|nr:aminotransferase class I/II-fold pyridoxal phosphate-dependent enzyme [Gluconacetobacter azotocaptans]MBM9400816.1 aminotransferase class I/II-fold pyridoxal phosphate-dependent enzyme [Gluconacetobacter azotocaptans]